MTKKKKAHGGYREGAGQKRKFEDLTATSICLTEGQYQGLLTLVGKGKFTSISEAIRLAVDKVFGLPAK